MLLQIIGPLTFDYQLFETNQASLFVDGGLNHQLTCTHAFNQSLGDGDSTNLALDHQFPTKKDLTDFELALNLISENISEVKFLGFYGARADHFLAQIGPLNNLAKKFPQLKIKFFTDSEIIHIVGNPTSEFILNGHFSLLSLETQKINITGPIDYPGNIVLEALCGRGISNYCHQGSIKLKASKPFMLIHPQKDAAARDNSAN
jgi:thiamine pyrophosphokinase